MIDLFEARVALLTLARPSVEYCKANRIDWQNTEPACGGVYLAPVVPLPRHRFEFDPDGEVVAVCDAIGADGVGIVDLVAWSLGDPTKIRTALGAAPVVGENVAANPATYFGGAPLRLFRTPLGWLKAGCDGVSVFDLDRAARWFVDLALPLVAAEDDKHASELHGALVRLIASARIVVPDRRAT